MNALAALLLLCSAHATPASDAEAEARARLCLLRARHSVATPQNPAQPAKRSIPAADRKVESRANGDHSADVNKMVAYPSRSQSGRRWTGCADWRHLTTGEHAGQFDAAWLRSLDPNQVQALHADAHEGRVQWPLVVRPARTPAAPSTSHARGYWTTERVCTKNGCTTRRVWRSH